MARHLARLLVLAIAAAACQPAPSATPGVPSGGASTTPPASQAGASTPPASTVPGAVLAGELRDAISIDDIVADLERLDQIAAANGGTRVAGEAGYDASVQLVAEVLRAAGYDVELVPAEIPTFRVDAPTVVEILAPGSPTLHEPRDVKPLLLSPPGDVTATVFALGFDPDAQPGSREGLGCDPADWTNVPAGVIALVQAGPCPRRTVIVNAQAAGVLAIVTAYPEWTADQVRRPTLVDPEGLEIPALGATHEAGVALFAAATAGARVHIVVSTTVEIEPTMNVIAETPGGDAERVVMLGGHLDSVVDGPGINDNGSGTMTVLEIARELAGLRPDGAPWKVRVAFWTGEETGLLGSADYVSNLDRPTIEAIAAYLNFDMLGSRNGVRQVYDATGATRPAASGVIQDLFQSALDAEGLAWELVEVGAASDHFPFDQNGVPVGGLFSGANELLTADQALQFGGTAGAPADACYHLLCDTAENVDPVLLGELARAAAWVTGQLASGEVVLPEG